MATCLTAGARGCGARRLWRAHVAVAHPQAIRGVAQGPRALSACARRSLRLDNCHALRNGELHSSSLQRLSIVACKGLTSLRVGCPALRELVLEECDQVQRIALWPVGTEALSLGTCPSLAALDVAAPAMRRLDLRCARAGSHPGRRARPACAPHEARAAPRARGCGVLADVRLRCPALEALDATFCARLGSAALAGIIASAPPLHTLVLSVCQALDTAGLGALRGLATLRVLDLSYTEVQARRLPARAAGAGARAAARPADAGRARAQDLAPVFLACAGLHTLKLSSCAYLRDDALAALLPSGQAAACGPAGRSPAPGACAAVGGALLPSLTELDVSYCPLPTRALADLLIGVPRLEVRGASLRTRGPGSAPRRPAHVHAVAPQVLAINGCSGATAELWRRLSQRAPAPAPERHALHALSAVGCKNLRACWLGMLPATARDWAAQARRPPGLRERRLLWLRASLKRARRRSGCR